MIAEVAHPLKRLTTALRLGRREVPATPATTRVPLERPALNLLAASVETLPARIAEDAVARKDLRLLGELPWEQFPTRPRRPAGGPWPGTPPAPRGPYVAAFLVKLHEQKPSMGALRTYLVEHPALVWVLGFPLVADPTTAWGFDVARSLPSRKPFSRVLRELDNEACQFLLDAPIPLVRDALPEELRAQFGQVVCGDTKAILAWVRENNPKAYLKKGQRFDSARQPAGDPDCKVGIKKKRNPGPDEADEAPATPAREPTPAGSLQIGEDILWGYASGLLTTRVGNWCEVVLSEQTKPFNRSDISSFEQWLAEATHRLGFHPPYSAFDAAYDAWYVQDEFAQVGGFAAVPRVDKGGQAPRTFDAEGYPCCAAGLGMPLLFTFQDRTTSRHEQTKGRFGCPLLTPQPTGAPCPLADPHFAKGGCITTMGTSAGARLRYTLDRESAQYKAIYNQRTADERLNSQAKTLGIERPKLRNQASITNTNTLIYVLLNLGELFRLRARRDQEARHSTGA